MFDNIAKNVATKKKKGTNNMTLSSVLVALSMADEGIDKETIATQFGLSKDQLNFRVFEKQANFQKKDKEGNVIAVETKCRSLMKHMYEDHTDPNSGIVDGETFAKRLFEAFGEEYEGPEQIDRMIDEWKESNTEATA